MCSDTAGGPAISYDTSKYEDTHVYILALKYITNETWLYIVKILFTGFWGYKKEQCSLYLLKNNSLNLK